MKNFAKDNHQTRTKKTIKLLLAILAAFCIAAIAYESFYWYEGNVLSMIGAWTVSALSLGTFFALRYVGLDKAIKLFKDRNRPDLVIQDEFIDKLRHTNPAHKQTIQQTYSRVYEKMTQSISPNQRVSNEFMQKLTQAFIQELENAENKEDFFQEPAVYEKFVKVFNLTVDLLIGTVLSGIPAGLLFTQKGTDGVDVIAGVFGQTVTNLPKLAQLGIGAMGGAVSGGFYAVPGFEARRTIIDVLLHTYQRCSIKDPKLAIKTLSWLILLTAANILSASSNQNVAQSILERPDHALFFINKDLAETAFIDANVIATCITNVIISYKSSILNRQPPVNEMSQMEDLSLYFKNRRHTEAFPLETVRNCSLFNSNNAKNPDPEIGQVSRNSPNLQGN